MQVAVCCSRYAHLFVEDSLHVRKVSKCRAVTNEHPLFIELRALTDAVDPCTCARIEMSLGIPKESKRHAVKIGRASCRERV